MASVNNAADWGQRLHTVAIVGGMGNHVGFGGEQMICWSAYTFPAKITHFIPLPLPTSKYCQTDSHHALQGAGQTDPRMRLAPDTAISLMK